jgi:F0F1-type ATP synthase membrane subunit b/b'
MLIFQMGVKGWGDLLDRYGLALVFLAVVLFAIWKFGVPLVNKLLEAQWQQLTESRQAREIERNDFLKALKEVTGEHKAGMEKLAESVDHIREEVRRSKG